LVASAVTLAGIKFAVRREQGDDFIDAPPHRSGSRLLLIERVRHPVAGANIMKDQIFKRSIIVTRCALMSVIVVALSAGCGSSTSFPTNPSTCGISPTNPEGTNPCNLLTVTIKNGVYSPNPVMVKVGQSVNWLNADTFAHTATDPAVFDTGSIAPTSAADAPVLFTTAGTYNYHCAIHANESATIIVTR
jgi:plastocyanin